MPNTLKIYWEPNELRLSLINIKRWCNIPSEEHLLEEVVSETLGWVNLGYSSVDELISISKTKEALQYSGTDRKLKRLVNRLKNNTIGFPIEEIEVDKKILNCQWMYEYLEELFSIEFHGINIEHTNETFVCLDEGKEAYELVLIYKDKEIKLLDQQQMAAGTKEIDISFSLSFSLDTAMKFVVFEKWKDYGVIKYKEISRAIFYHPIFYTGDEMNIHVHQTDGKWKFKLTHLDTKEEMFF